MTAKQRIIECLTNANDDLTAEEAIHRIVLWKKLDAASRDDVEMDHDDFVRELTAEGAFDESPVELDVG